MLTVTPRDQVSTYIRVGVCARGGGVQLSGACIVRNVDHAPTCFLDYEGGCPGDAEGISQLGLR